MPPKSTTPYLAFVRIVQGAQPETHAQKARSCSLTAAGKGFGDLPLGSPQSRAAARALATAPLPSHGSCSVFPNRLPIRLDECRS